MTDWQPIERLEKENELLQKELQKHLTYQEHRYGRIGTHDPICYGYGPSHYECALREIERLRETLKKIADLKTEYTWDEKDKPYVMINFMTFELAITMAEDALKEGE